MRLGPSHSGDLTRVVAMYMVAVTPVLRELALLTGVQGRRFLALQGLPVASFQQEQQQGAHVSLWLTVVLWSVVVMVSL